MIKRLFDISISLVTIITLMPLFALIAVAVKIDSPGAVFFTQKRIGKAGIPFNIYKFRSMYSSLSPFALKITASGDTRITNVGRFLRTTKLDELPQLVNVLLGSMSFVGPRPEVEEYVRKYTDEQKKVLSVKPGITDIASICYMDEEKILARSTDLSYTYEKVVMPAKLDLNMRYIKKQSFFYDIYLIIKTLQKILIRN